MIEFDVIDFTEEVKQLEDELSSLRVESLYYELNTVERLFKFYEQAFSCKVVE